MIAQRRIAYLIAPDFGTQVLQRADPGLVERPWALLDDRNQVLTLNGLAARCGVTTGQTEQQALARCPTVTLRPASRYPVFETQAGFLDRVAKYADRWQPAGLGCAYLNPTHMGDMTTWCQALAADIRGLGLTPGLGLTSSKFSAFTAGQAAGGNTMLLMSAIAERSFVATQPVTLLPLEAAMLLNLRHLGIRTLGDYARLPAAGVLARFGEAGRTAQRWAQGNDERPVIPPDELPQVSSRIEFDTPVTDQTILLAALMQRTSRLLTPLHASLQAAGRLSLAVLRADRRILPADHTFPLPTAATATIRSALAAVLDRMAWDGEGASEVTLTLGDISDAPSQQLSLLDDASTTRATLMATLERLAARFGPHTFQMAVLTDANHPLPERRSNWKEFS